MTTTTHTETTIDPSFLQAVAILAPGPVTFDATESASGVRAVFHVAHEDDRERSQIRRIVAWREAGTVRAATIGASWRQVSESTLPELIEQAAAAQAEDRQELAA